MLGGAAVLSRYGLGLLLAFAVVVALDQLWPLSLAAFVTAVAIAGTTAMIGRRQVSGATPLLPTQAPASITADAQTLKDAVEEGHTS